MPKIMTFAMFKEAVEKIFDNNPDFFLLLLQISLSLHIMISVYYPFVCVRAYQ